ncbi:fumarylacetoacetase [Bordetella hinzii]|uniref:fumarylacetoacetase n=2 Tax=Bordetella hinzii TaxID=103855 RepID=A0AAN1VF34_9BORD|nr:fumarylacetoacetase [Bordetella hinzii]AKQ58574.1 Fumarylacetoacetate (FAA) hydrolase family protein [Bordetella hinzii]AZW16122.1 fumarylacetoacetase [Bordetella hinzii]KCB25926.1 fumarylacetoacetase [Bordetella hinzii OH87 BAL007II]KCB49188.1 fumarylacetoacetase [Bordetella hinzii 4161]KXA71921.1 fumarylacetoacetase [Bordetella hinzii LMG 13501]
MTLNETHDPALKSWVASANDGQTDFPIQNLPFASFRRRGSQEAFRPGVAIGQAIVDLGALRAARPFDGDAALALEACADTHLNALMALGPKAWSALRLALSRALREGAAQRALIEPLLLPQAEAEFTTPARIGDYTDFYISLHHATAVGKQFRPDNPLLPNYKWVPIGYHGRASSIGVEQRFARPVGQQRPAAEGEAPQFGPCKRLDYELELSIFVGQGNAQGDRIALASAEQHVFGLGILNDWSARDIQAWEYQPLGPFLAKNFASTISPWIVTLEALEPFRTQWKRPEGDPQPLPYLTSETNRAEGAFDVQMEVLITTEASRARQAQPARLSRSNFRDAYWNVAQLIAHHTVNGCNLQAGDMLGTGTLSGPSASEAGSLLELSQGGKTPVELPWGETRAFLEDGDQIIIRAECIKPGYPRIGFGQCVGTVAPARL